MRRRIGLEPHRKAGRRAPGRRAALLLVVAAMASGIIDASAAGGQTELFAGRRLWSHVAGGPELTGYSRAMTQYRLWLQQPRRPAGAAAPISPADYDDDRWTWRADDGSIIRRLDDGRFSVTRGDCVSSLCLELFCFDAGWPMFMCDDGATRKMSAPNFSTVIFDDVTFTRGPATDLPDQ